MLHIVYPLLFSVARTPARMEEHPRGHLLTLKDPLPLPGPGTPVTTLLIRRTPGHSGRADSIPLPPGTVGKRARRIMHRTAPGSPRRDNRKATCLHHGGGLEANDGITRENSVYPGSPDRERQVFFSVQRARQIMQFKRTVDHMQNYISPG